MKDHGDFSRKVSCEKGDNCNALFYQQGRVLTDADGTTQTRLINDWQHAAARDIIGNGVAAIPSEEPNSFKIKSAKFDVNEKKILIEVLPGRGWVDGFIVYLENELPKITRIVYLENELPKITRTATYLGPPFNPESLSVSAGARDAVILEVYQEALNAFQVPDRLLEPALGGPDTTEMLHTSFAFKLLRLSDGDNCSNMAAKLEDDFSKKGKLTVTLDNPPPVTGECPVDENFGYTGITHNLYRIEVADVNSGASAKFKWSKFNGGMVGRGNYIDPTTRSGLMITLNLQAIIWSDMTDLYLEIVKYDKDAGYWKVVYGTAATLNAPDKEIIFSGVPIFGTNLDLPDDNDGIFFRLWNGIRDISDFASDTILIDGILLKFDTPAASIYKPEDYWLFEVRAGGIEMRETLIDDSPPHGVHYHRVPLSIIEWKADNTTSIIEDCRVIFPPLTEQKEGGGCCTLKVGDGTSSHGDYDSLQEAINSIGQIGGEICLLDGAHETNAFVKDQSDLVIRGCGNRVKLINKDTKFPIITFLNSSNIRLEGIELVANKAVAIRIDATCKGIKIQNNIISSIGNPESVKALIEVINGIDVTIHSNRVILQEGKGVESAMYLRGQNIKVTKNIITAQFLTTGGAGAGLHIGSGSQNINIIENKIEGGSSNGITLGDPVKGNEPPPFIYKVRIDGNEISGMGLCGIGVPRLLRGSDPVDVTPTMALGTSIFDLEIRGNRISSCLQNPYDESMLKEVNLHFDSPPIRGFGGILLTCCKKLIIEDNKIEHNGTQHIDPVCGIFIYFVSEVEIVQNYIYNNGPIIELQGLIKEGQRGGITLFFSSSLNPKGFPNGGYATRIHNNYVSQPAGNALDISGTGIVSVVSNYFNCELRGVCVRIANSSRIGDEIGATVYECNQSRLGQFNTSGNSHVIFGNDIQFGSNHIVCLNRGSIVSTWLHCVTQRVYNNRWKEPVAAGDSLSLFANAGQMNITVNNQADHCISSFSVPNNPIPDVITGNQVLNSSGCEQIHNKIFSKISEIAKSYDG